MSNSGQNAAKIRVALIYGGVSGEHSISCVTAGAVMAALDRAKYEIVSIGITPRGEWVPGETDSAALALQPGCMPHVSDSDKRLIIPPGSGHQSLVLLEADGTAKNLGAVDVAFPLLHGPFGEDGTIQGLLELANIPYVGCGVFASSAGMDKCMMKTVLEQAHIPVAPYAIVNPGQWEHNPTAVLERVAKLRYPLYVKPARAGSSLGITKVHDISQLDAAISLAHRYDPKVLIEEGIDGREVECGVLGGHGLNPARASVPGEVILDVAQEDFYDFEHKYLNTQALTNQIPADVSPDVSENVSDIARRAFEAFGCEGLARVDCFVRPDSSVLVNEINTMPGFTPFSMYPKLWEYMGLAYSQLVDELISLALERGTGLH